MGCGCNKNKKPNTQQKRPISSNEVKKPNQLISTNQKPIVKKPAPPKK